MTRHITPKILKARAARLTKRLLSVEADFRSMFRVGDWDDSGDAVEVLRNLGTAIVYLRGFDAMSEIGLQKEIDTYGLSHGQSDGEKR